MKKWLILSLVFQVAATSSPAQQGISGILKMGAFVHHFAHHLHCHGEEIGVLDFVSLHYLHGRHHEQDHDEHQDLPFQSHDQSQGGLSSFNLFFFQEKFQVNTSFHIFKKPVFHYAGFVPSSQFGTIWKPPKA